MSERKSSGVWAAVVGALVTAVAAQLLGWMALMWGWLSGALGVVVTHLSAQSSMPNWLAYLLSLISAAAALSAARRYWRSRKDSHERFNQFIWRGVRWRWRYIAGRPLSPMSYCAVCDTQLVYEHVRDTYALRPLRTRLHCEHCGTVPFEEAGALDAVTGRVVREIDRIIRTNQWTDNNDPANR